MNRPPVDIARIEGDQRRAAIASLARAFFDDPLFGYFQPDLLRQQKTLPAFMRGTLLDATPFGETWVALSDGKAKGVAAWLPPGTYPRSAGRNLAVNVRSAPALLHTAARLPEAVKLLATVDKIHPKIEHWYLALLGVDPELQGRGVGTRLLEPVLARCDADRVPAYLETQKPENVSWYARAGFEVVEEVRLPGAKCPPIWTLQREPRG